MILWIFYGIYGPIGLVPPCRAFSILKLRGGLCSKVSGRQLQSLPPLNMGKASHDANITNSSLSYASLSWRMILLADGSSFQIRPLRYVQFSPEWRLWRLPF